MNVLINVVSCHVDVEAVRAKLMELDLDQLKKFIEDKGNARKKDLYNTCIFQTTDATKTKVLADSLDVQLDRARERQDRFNRRLDHYNDELTEAVDRITHCEK